MFVLARAVTYAALFIGLVLIYVPARLLSWSGVVRPAATDVQQVACAESDFTQHRAVRQSVRGGKNMKRKSDLLLGSVVFFLVAAGLLISPAPVYSQTEGQERRDDRQDARDVKQTGREDARAAKAACKEGDEKTRAECRKEKRDVKEGARDAAQDVKGQ